MTIMRERKPWYHIKPEDLGFVLKVRRCLRMHFIMLFISSNTISIFDASELTAFTYIYLVTYLLTFIGSSQALEFETFQVRGKQELFAMC